MRILVDSTPRKIIAYTGADAYRDYFGMLTMPRSRFLPDECIRLGAPWALDNYAFSNFDTHLYERMLTRYRDYPGCLFVTAPDVVGNARATLNLFAIWRDRIQGYPLALVAQDGLEALPVPWDQFEALFIGGSTAWKLSNTAAHLVHEAKTRGKWVHMGRVNSLRRLRYAHSIGCDSVDGSGFTRWAYKIMQALPALTSKQLILGGF